MKMYLDDLRTPVEEFDFVVRSYEEALSIIKNYGMPNYISFDHDLGADIDGTIEIPEDFTFKVHSQNPVGKQNIISLLKSYLIHKNTTKKS